MITERIEVRKVQLDDIVVGDLQPRKTFDEIKLSALADSLELAGDVTEPITVRPKGKKYELVAGERRVRAARQAGLSELSAFIREMSDEEAEEAALVSNLQREDLNPVDEAVAIALHAAHLAGTSGLENGIKELRITFNFKRKDMLNNYFKHIDDMLIRVTGGDIFVFKNTKLRLLLMATFLQEAVACGDLDPTKATLIARLKDVDAQRTVLATAVKKGYNWREVKDLVAAAKKKARGEKPTPPKPYIYNAFLPTKVKLSNLRDFVDSLDLDDDTESEVASLVDNVFALFKSRGLLGS